MEFVLSILLASGVLTLVAWRTIGHRSSAISATQAKRKPLGRAFAAIRRPGETDASFVVANAPQRPERDEEAELWLALTNQRLIIGSGSAALRSFDRDAVAINARRTLWSDKREMFTVKAEGYDVKLALPAGESLQLRLYAANADDPGHDRALTMFLANAGVPLAA